jgi:hypothetical protein
MQWFAHSPELRLLKREGLAAKIPLRVAFADALRALRGGGGPSVVAPAGPLALLKSSRVGASAVGVLPGARARPRAARPM